MEDAHNYHPDGRRKRSERSTAGHEEEQQTTRPLQSQEGWILFVRNLNEETSEDDVSGHFSEYGHVMNVHLNLDRRTGFVKGYCLVEYELFEDAANARESLNNSSLLGSDIKVDWAFVVKPEKNHWGSK